MQGQWLSNRPPTKQALTLKSLHLYKPGMKSIKRKQSCIITNCHLKAISKCYRSWNKRQNLLDPNICMNFKSRKNFQKFKIYCWFWFNWNYLKKIINLTKSKKELKEIYIKQILEWDASFHTIYENASIACILLRTKGNTVCQCSSLF